MLAEQHVLFVLASPLPRQPSPQHPTLHHNDTEARHNAVVVGWVASGRVASLVVDQVCCIVLRRLQAAGVGVVVGWAGGPAASKARVQPEAKRPRLRSSSTG